MIKVTVWNEYVQEQEQIGEKAQMLFPGDAHEEARKWLTETAKKNQRSSRWSHS